MQLQLNSLSKSYHDLQVLRDFTLTLSYEKIHCLFGPSGCGKTTLLNVLVNLTPADAGSIEGIKGKTFSYIFQEDRLLPWATVKENILFILKSHYSIVDSERLADEYLALVNLTSFKKHYPDQLSGGMKQRVAIARAFAHQGDILVMDEPFKGLDLKLKRNLMDYIISFWKQKKKLLIFVTHDIDEALYMADKIHVFSGPPLTLINQISIPISHEKRAESKEALNEYREQLIIRESTR
ncbi:NitT/TauT family transport system ATP-binding protein [Desulfitispora alkaliphila]|uniref:ABC transporter ATP-binding protein n=1 Tax=Desulfitispora alkaliphila TaxID=622674 RepID=UPI003D1D3DBD